MGIGEVGEKLRRGTVQVWSGRSACGSGVIRDAAGVIVTNAHVARSEELRVELRDGRALPARLERRDDRRDLAILRVHAAGLEPIPTADSGRVRVGELAIAVGSPFGFTGALSTGVVHGIGPVRGLGSQPFIHTTARLAPGNSGGPLADATGNLIGINAMVVAGGIGLAVPAGAVERLLGGGAPVELGVAVRPVRIPGLDRNIALLVLEIAPGSPAEYASLRVGDVLVGAGGTPFSSPGDLRDALDRGAVTLHFLRGGERRQREVTVRLARPHGLAA